MNFKAIPDALKQAYYKGSFYVHQNSAELYLGAGIVTGIAGAVSTGISSAKMPDILAQHRAEVEIVHAKAEDQLDGYHEGRELTKVYAKTVFKIVRLYALPAALEAVSTACVLKSFGIEKNRAVMFAGAAIAAEEKLANYRKNVVERFGEAVDHELAGEYKEEKRLMEVVDPDTGETHEEEVTVKVLDDGHTEWARRWGPGSPGWVSADYVGAQGQIDYINAQKKAILDILQYKRHVYANDVYRVTQLGIFDAKTGRVKYEVKNGYDWGIIYDPNKPLEEQFGWGLEDTEDGRRFLAGEKVDGCILDPGKYFRPMMRAFLPSNEEVREYEKEVVACE